MSDDDGLLQDFVAESNEHLEHIEDDFLQLENQGADADPEQINTVFRAIHSIKGAAGFLGLEVIQRLAHAMENLLDRMRNGQVAPERENISALLAGADQLRAMLDDVEASNQIDVGDHLDRLQALLVDDAAVRSGGADTDALPIAFHDDHGTEVPLKVEPERWYERSSDHAHFYLLHYDLSHREVSEGKDPLAAIDELNLTGAVLASRIQAPEADLRQGLPTAPLVCQVLYATVFDPAIVAGALGIAEDAVRRVYPSFPSDAKSAHGCRPSPPSFATLPSPTPTPATSSADDATTPAPHDQLPSSSSSEPITAKSDNGTRRANKPETVLLSSGIRNETIRLNVDRIDRLMALAGELVLVRNRSLMMFQEREGAERQISQQLDLVTSELQEAIMGMRMQPIGQVFTKLPRIVRDLGHKLDKSIELITVGNEVEVDKSILEALGDPLVHLARNACDHGIDSPEERRQAGKTPQGTVRVEARHEAGQIVVVISDDGRGIDAERIKRKALERGLKSPDELVAMSDKDAINLVMLPGFSTAEAVTDVSGRGVGMDVVKQSIESFGGSLEVDSHLGQGSIFTLRLPLTLAIIPSLVVTAGDERFAIPQTNLEEIVRLYGDDVATRIEWANNQAVFRLREELLPLVDLDDILQHDRPFDDEDKAAIAAAHQQGNTRDRLTFAVVRVGSHRFGLIVRDVIGSEEIVVKPMHPALKNLRCYAGSTVMGDGRVALILDINGISQHVKLDFSWHDFEQAETAEHTTENHAELLFTCGGQEQFAIATGLIKRILKVSASDFETVGDRRYYQIDGEITQVIALDDHLDIGRSAPIENYFLILPRHIDRPVGVLAHSLVDVEVCDFDPHGKGRLEDGLLGTAVMRDRITLFVDLFRLVEMADPEGAMKRHRQEPRDEDKKTILLLEDTPFFRNLVAGYLEAGHYRVLTAHDGKDGLALLEDHQVHGIVSDLEMPVMDGFAFIRAVRADQRHQDLPALALTSLKDAEVRARALREGFDAFEVKLDREQLLASLGEVMDRVRAEVRGGGV